MKKIYFASDFHLGLTFEQHSSKERERKIIAWLEMIAQDASDVYLLGDIFDFWFEYKLVVPKGHIRFLAKLGELVDKGINVHYFIGNHDIWTFDYLSQELGIKIYKKPLLAKHYEKTFFVAHGDGLGKGDTIYKILHFIFHNKILLRLYKMIHPRFGIGLGYAWSRYSRKKKGVIYPFQGQTEPLYKFAEEYISKNQTPVNYFIFGHRHTPIQLTLNSESVLILLSDWIADSRYVVFDGEETLLLKY